MARKKKPDAKRLFEVSVRREYELSEAYIYVRAWSEKGAREAARNEASKHADEYFGGCALVFDTDCEEIEDTDHSEIEVDN